MLVLSGPDVVRSSESPAGQSITTSPTGIDFAVENVILFLNTGFWMGLRGVSNNVVRRIMMRTDTVAPGN